jgi:hypothetical protein
MYNALVSFVIMYLQLLNFSWYYSADRFHCNRNSENGSTKNHVTKDATTENDTKTLSQVLLIENILFHYFRTELYLSSENIDDSNHAGNDDVHSLKGHTNITESLLPKCLKRIMIHIIRCRLQKDIEETDRLLFLRKTIDQLYSFNEKKDEGTIHRSSSSLYEQIQKTVQTIRQIRLSIPPLITENLSNGTKHIKVSKAVRNLYFQCPLLVALDLAPVTTFPNLPWTDMLQNANNDIQEYHQWIQDL